LGVAVKIADTGGFFEPCRKRSMKSDTEAKLTPKKLKSNQLKKVEKNREKPFINEFFTEAKSGAPMRS
jgi:hypothetical protein